MAAVAGRSDAVRELRRHTDGTRKRGRDKHRTDPGHDGARRGSASAHAAFATRYASASGAETGTATTSSARCACAAGRAAARSC